MGILAEKKEKRYVSDNAQLMAEWNWEKNNELKLTPESLTLCSGRKVWWKCSKGHEWQASIAHRSNGCGCPVCAQNNRRRQHSKNWIEKKGSLAVHNPQLSKEWHPRKNGELTPNDVACNSHQKVWWKCSNGHEWEAIIANRNKGRNCPYCSGRKVLLGYNDIPTVNPKLVKQWDYEKNNNLRPENFTVNSHKKVWWKCNRGHEWQATIANRNNGRECPICATEHSSSFPEYAIVYYLKKYGLKPIHLWKERGYELDVYIPSMKIAIEYDGFLWHQNKAKNDLEKNQKCKKDGIKLYRIREELSPLYDTSIDYIVKKNQEDLSIILIEILSDILGTYVDVDIKRDYIAIENLREYTEKDYSLLFSNPEVATEWNYDKNGNLRPEHLTANSHKKVWWKCSKGHEWQASISDRNNGRGCPYCSNQKVLRGYNDLQIINPNLVKEWNYEKNELTPVDVTANSNKKVWWKCHNGHEWQATIANRNMGKGCPYCSGRYVVKGKNDLQSINPNLAKEWNYEKNELTPADVTPNSHKKVWWKCHNGHEWQAIISDRNRGRRCPICARRKNK